VAGCRERGCTPHGSQNNTNCRSAIDGRTTRHPGYRLSTINRKRIEEPFGWMKTVGGLRKRPVIVVAAWWTGFSFSPPLPHSQLAAQG